jgi:hypothetical protein
VNINLISILIPFLRIAKNAVVPVCKAKIPS